MNSRSFENIETQIKDELKMENVFEKLYNSTDYILNIINTIVETDGINWASKVMDDKGNNVLTEEEQAQFTSSFQPYINSILRFFGKSVEQVEKVEQVESTMGGALTYEQKKELMKKNAPKKYIKEQSEEQSKEPKEPKKIPGIDEIFTEFMDKIDTANQLFKKGSQDVGILKIQSQLDATKMDQIVPFVGLVPVRLLIFAVYLLIDILRIMASVSGIGLGRKILSIVIAIFDLLKGDWKKAILSFIGFFSSDALILGVISKIFLSLFETLNPDKQETIIYGAYGTIKSLLVGILLSILQIGAPMHVREYIMELIRGIDDNHEVKSWDDINNIQLIFDNPKITCNNQFQESLKTLPSFVKIVAQLLGVPERKDVKEGQYDDIINKIFDEKCKDHKNNTINNKIKSAHEKMEESKKVRDKKIAEQKASRGAEIAKQKQKARDISEKAVKSVVTAQHNAKQERDRLKQVASTQQFK